LFLFLFFLFRNKKKINEGLGKAAKSQKVWGNGLEALELAKRIVIVERERERGKLELVTLSN
jgi:hypothetical protein